MQTLLERTRENAHRQIAECRAWYDSEIGKLSPSEAMLNLLNQQTKSELKIRSVSIGDYIQKQGLTEYQEDIIQGMSKSLKRVTLYDDSQEVNFLSFRKICEHDSSAILDYAFDYVDRFKMYHELWGEK